MSKQSVKPKPVKDSFVGIPIERGIPVPAGGGRGPRGPQSLMAQAFVKLKPMESFAVPLEQKSRLAGMASGYAKKLGWKYVVRELDGFARVWRLS